MTFESGWFSLVCASPLTIGVVELGREKRSPIFGSDTNQSPGTNNPMRSCLVPFSEASMNEKVVFNPEKCRVRREQAVRVKTEAMTREDFDALWNAIQKAFKK